MKLSIIVPCYNEARNIPLILGRFSEAVRRPDVELVLVDNGSTDDSADVLKRLLPDYPFARTVRVEVNQGYGFGILSGLRAADGQYIGWTHADMQTDPCDTVRALGIIEGIGSPDDIYVKGRRRGRTPFDVFFTAGMGVFETLYMGVGLWDINAQPNIFHRTFFEGWTNPPHDFSLDLYALYTARKKGLRIIRLDVEFPPRLHGHSSWNTGLGSKWKFIKRTVEFSRRLKKGFRDGVHSAQG